VATPGSKFSSFCLHGPLYDEYMWIYTRAVTGIIKELERQDKYHPEDTSSFCSVPVAALQQNEQEHVVESDMGHHHPVEMKRLAQVVYGEGESKETEPVKRTVQLVTEYFRNDANLFHSEISLHMFDEGLASLKNIKEETINTVRVKATAFHHKLEDREEDMRAKLDIRMGEVEAQLAPFRIKCSDVRSTGDHRRIVKAMFNGALMDLACILGFFFAIFTLYRAMYMFRRLKTATVWEWKRIVVARTLLEMFYDVLFVLECLIITAFVYPLMDFFGDMIEQDSVRGARIVAHSYIMVILSDLWAVLAFFVQCKIYLYFFTTALWGIIVPAASVSQVLKDTVGCFDFVRRYFSFFLWVFFFVFPYIIVYRIVPDNALRSVDDTYVFDDDGIHSVNVAIGVYLLLLLCIVLSSVFSVSRRAAYTEIAHPSKVVMMTGPNALSIVYMLLDAFQMASLPWAVLQLRDGEGGSLSGSGGVQSALGDVSRRVLFFVDGTYMITVVTAIVLVSIWYFVISLPTVVEDLLSWKEKGTIASTPFWRFLTYVLSGNLYLTIIYNLVKPIQCSYVDIGGGTMVGFLINKPESKCWDTETSQPVLAAVALSFFAFFIFTSFVIPEESGMRHVQLVEKLDIRFPQVYLMSTNTIKVLLGVSVALYSDTPWLVLSIILASSLFMFIFTAFYNKIYGSPACCIEWVVVLQSCVALIVAASASVAMIELRDREQSGYTLNGFDSGWIFLIVLFLVGICGIFLIIGKAVMAQREQQARLKEMNMDKTVSDWKTMEENMFEGGFFLPQWEKERKKWLKRLESSGKPLSFSMRLLEMEQNIRLTAYNRRFLKYRFQWKMCLTNPDKWGGADHQLRSVLEGMTDPEDGMLSCLCLFGLFAFLLFPLVFIFFCSVLFCDLDFSVIIFSLQFCFFSVLDTQIRRDSLGLLTQCRLLR